MNIVICGSIDFTYKIKEVADVLLKQGHKIEIPFYSQKILNGEISLEEFLRVKKENGDMGFRKNSKEDLIKRGLVKLEGSGYIRVQEIEELVRGKVYVIDEQGYLQFGPAYVPPKTP